MKSYAERIPALFPHSWRQAEKNEKMRGVNVEKMQVENQSMKNEIEKLKKQLETLKAEKTVQNLKLRNPKLMKINKKGELALTQGNTNNPKIENETFWYETNAGDYTEKLIEKIKDALNVLFINADSIDLDRFVFSSSSRKSFAKLTWKHHDTIFEKEIYSDPKKPKMLGWDQATKGRVTFIAVESSTYLDRTLTEGETGCLFQPMNGV